MNSNQNNTNFSNMCQDFQGFMRRIINSTPLFIRFIISATIILYFFNIFIPYIALFLSNIPYFTIFYFQIWRLITTSFMTTGIINIIFLLLFWFKDAVKLEKETGTIKYMLTFLLNNICIQIMYCLLLFFLSLIIGNSALLTLKVTSNGVVNQGLWPIVMCDLTLLCLSNPEEQVKFFIFPCLIKAKYYPLVLFLIFTIMNGFNIDFETLCGIGFGFLYHFYLKNILYISNNFSLKVENSCLFKWMKNRNGYINVGGGSIPNLQNNLENVRNVNINQNNSNTHKTFKAFSGKGISVGGGKQINNNNNSNTNNYNNNNTENNNNSNNNTNVTVNSSDEINSSDSRLDLNSSTTTTSNQK